MREILILSYLNQSTFETEYILIVKHTLPGPGLYSINKH